MYCVGMVYVTPASRYITYASRYQSISSMYIRGLIPRNPTELAKAFPIDPEYDKIVLCAQPTKRIDFFVCAANTVIRLGRCPGYNDKEFNPFRVHYLSFKRLQGTISKLFLFMKIFYVSYRLDPNCVVSSGFEHLYKVRERAKNRNRYNQALHLTQDTCTNGK